MLRWQIYILIDCFNLMYFVQTSSQFNFIDRDERSSEIFALSKAHLAIVVGVLTTLPVQDACGKIENLGGKLRHALT